MPATLESLDVRLSEAQVAAFHREGFLRLDRIVTPEDLNLLRGILSDEFARFREMPARSKVELGTKKDDFSQAVIPQLFNMLERHPEIRDGSYYRNAEAIARQLLGEESQFIGEHAICKPPHNRKETPWHQDQAYWNKDDHYHAVNFWLPLQDTPVERGCMQFIPRSHQGDLLPHYPAGHDPSMHTLQTHHADPSQAVPCPLRAGGATMHHQKVLHYTGPNRTDEPRLAYILIFGYHWEKRGA